LHLPASHSGTASIRAPTPADAEAIAELLGVLGYPATRDEVLERLPRLTESESVVILVADVEGRAVGVVTGHVFSSIHVSGPVAWLTTLVVSDRHQHQGIGAQLASAIEHWARDHGAARVSVTSGQQRHGAHRFYERLGYERTGVRLTKAL
jgi:GNAT superfamily N-acetyltransferase